MKKLIHLYLTTLALLLFSGQLLANVVLTTTPPNPSLINVPLTFSWIDDCELTTINYGDGNSDTDPVTISNSTVHTYELPGTYQVSITGSVCGSAGTQDFITVFIAVPPPGPTPTPGPYNMTPTEVSIERLQLYFDNNLPKISVPRNKSDLRAHAKIRYSGSGILQAYWTVDGRIFERIDQHLISAGTLELSTPDYIPLPTLINGPHSVQLVVTAPSLTATLPKAIYFVTQTDEQASKPQLIAPDNNFSITRANDIDFRWLSSSPPPGYLFEIIQQDNNKTVFSAYTKQPQYSLKQSFIESFLLAEKNYSWRVSALDNNSKVVASSEQNMLSVEQKSWAVEHQFLLIVEDSLLGNSLKLRLIDEYQLDVIEQFSLQSLQQSVVVFQTQRESTQLLNELLKKNGVIGAQPDYIYRTSATPLAAASPELTQEPLQDLQSLSSMLDYALLHQRMTGDGSHIAVIDTGVQVDHPDLQGAEISTENFIRDEKYQSEIHGTAVSGIIAAQANAFGIVGLAPKTSILSLRACRQLQSGAASAECYSSSLARALDKAIVAHSQLVNFSFGTPAADPVMSNLILYSHAQGTILIAAAGNESDQQELSFPASHSAVISVAGMDGQLAYPSQLLADKADLLAPSEQIFSTVTGGRHNFLNGTSMSSAIVSGIVALALPSSVNSELVLKPQQRDFCSWVNQLLQTSICSP